MSKPRFLRNRFYFLDCFYKGLRNCSDKVRLEIYDAIMEISFFGKELKELSEEAEDYFCVIRPLLLKSLINYNNRMGYLRAKLNEEDPITVELKIK